MIFIKLDTLETVNQLCKISDKYKDKMNIDISYGRYIIDACSILGVTSLMGNIVKIVPVTDDTLLLHYYFNEIEKLGAYMV